MTYIKRWRNSYFAGARKFIGMRIIGFYRILRAAKVGIGHAKQIVCIGKIRFDSDGLLIGFYCILIAAKLDVGKAKALVGKAKTNVCLGVIRFDSDGLLI